MPIIVSDIRLPFAEPPEGALALAKKRLGVPGEYTITRRAVDARRKGSISFVYSVLAELQADERALAERLADPHVRLHEPTSFTLAPSGGPLSHRPVVAGFGPAGMFAALLLARHGYRPIVLERGDAVEKRAERVASFWGGGALDPESNVQFGEGGAGTFSDGKLTTRISDARCRLVLEELAAHGAPAGILTDAKPHIGTDQLREIVRNIRLEILSLGGDIRFRTRLDGLVLRDGHVRGVTAGGEELPADAVLLAPGHSARDTFGMLRQAGVAMEPKPFSVGVRIEHLQRDIDAALYGSAAGHPLLPPGEYQLSLRRGERAVYTFCMCPGGVVVAAASEQGGIVTNGMSEHARSGENANAALVVSVSPEDFGPELFDGLLFQQKLERAAFAKTGGYLAPVQTVGALLGGKSTFGSVLPSYPIGVKETNFTDVFPVTIRNMLMDGVRSFGGKLRGFDRADSVLTGVETRTSSPLRLIRDSEMQALGVAGLYPCGEGAGYAGGIMSAAVDGISAASALISRHKPSSG